MTCVASERRPSRAVLSLSALALLMAGCVAPAPLTASRDLDPETASDLRAAIPLLPVGAVPPGARPLGAVHGLSCMRSLVGRPASEADALDRLRYRARLMGADALANVACAPEKVIVGAAEGCLASVVCEGTALSRPAAPAPAPPPPSGGPATAGTANGVFVSARGDVVALAGSVAGCAALEVRGEDGRRRPAFVLAVDAANDLALLRVDRPPPRLVVFAARGDVRPGAPVIALGHPPAADPGDRPLVLAAQVAGLGAGGDSRFLRVSAAELADARGAPLLDGRGLFVGLMAGREGVALGAASIRAFLLAEGVPLAEREADTMAPAGDPADIGASLGGALVALACRAGT